LDFFPQKQYFYYQPILVFGSLQELPDDIQNMMEQWLRKKAYAPYSKFRVGAAPVRQWTNCSRLKSRNAAYPSGLCAERSYFSSRGYPEAKNLKWLLRSFRLNKT
jgi:cytidine deaminase